MPLYQIVRDFTGATQDQLSAAGLRAKMCLAMSPGLS